MQLDDQLKTKEEILRELKDYRAIFEVCGSSIAIVKEGAIISRVNTEFVNLFGYSKEEIEGKKKWYELCVVEDRDRVYDYYRLRRTDPASAPPNYDACFVHKNGSLIDTYVSVCLVPETREAVVAITNITALSKSKKALRKSHEELELRVKERTADLDKLNQALRAEIEERKRAEESIAAEQQRFNDVMEMLPAYLLLLTPDHQVTFANRYFRDRYGESQGRRCFEYLFGRSEPCENCESFRVLKTMTPHEWEWTGPDGRIYHVFDFPFTDVDGSTLIMEMGIDITEQKMTEEELQKAQNILESKVAERTSELNLELAQRKQAEEAFREANSYLENLFSYANAPIIVWDPDYRIIRFNQAFERITGYSSAEVLGKSLEILFPAAQKDESMALIQRTSSGERWETVEIAIAHVVGTVRTLLWNSATLFAADGTTVVATIAQGQDITDRKLVEEALRKSHEELELRVKERTADLEKLNQALRAEIEERKRAEEIISRQAQEILEVSTPVIQIWEGVVSVPLIGTLDSMRAQQLMEQLLEKIVETGSSVALLDVTGVPTIDTKTARYLIETISAVRLLGSEVVLTGIRPAIARTLAQLGVDLSNVNTRASFSSGLLFALTLLNLKVVNRV